MDDTSSSNSISATTTPTRYTNEGYALSGKIMLSAIIILFTVVIVIVGLHIYARWFLLRARRRHHHSRRRNRRTRIVFTTDLSTAEAHSRGLDSAVLKSLPTYLFSSTAHPEGLECAVCLSEFEDNEKARLLPKCNHSFHVECIDMWFHSHSTCPLCRVPIDSEVVIGTEPGIGEGAVQIVVDSGEVESRTSHGIGNREDHEMGTGSSASSASSSSSSAASIGSRRKALGVVGISIEVPRRNESFKGVEEELHGSPGNQGFRTPGGRILSFKRMLGIEKRASTPLGCSSAATASAVEIDLERGGEGEKEQSQPLTPPNRVKA